MLLEKIKYTDFNGIEREEIYAFNLSKAEILEMEMGTNGGMTKLIESLQERGDNAAIMKMFKNLILKAYGIKSVDGKRFEKSKEISTEFEQTGAYEELFVRLTTNPEAAAAFFKGILPTEALTADHEKPELKLIES